MTTNRFGFSCEAMIRDLLPQVGIPHKHERGDSKDWFWWGSEREDHCMGIDCWITIDDHEVPVDFTVISGAEQVVEKTNRALGRGVIPVFIPQRLLTAAEDGDERALRDLSLEIRAQISLKKNLLKGNMMTRELAAVVKNVMCPKSSVPVIVNKGAALVSAKH